MTNQCARRGGALRILGLCLIPLWVVLWDVAELALLLDNKHIWTHSHLLAATLAGKCFLATVGLLLLGRTFNLRRQVLRGWIAYVLLGAAYQLGFSVVTQYLSEDTTVRLLAAFALRCVLAVVAILAAKKLFGVGFFGRGKLGRGLFRCGWCLWLYGLGLLVYAYAAPQKSLAEALPSLALSALTMLGVGLYEETLWHSVLFHTMEDGFGETKKGVVLSVVLSSVLFGQAHMFNLLGYEGAVAAVMAQVCYAMIVGFALGVIHVRTKSIALCVLFHALLDFFGGFWSHFLPAAPTASEEMSAISPWAAVIQVLLFLPLLVVSIFQLRATLREAA